MRPECRRPLGGRHAWRLHGPISPLNGGDNTARRAFRTVDCIQVSFISPERRRTGQALKSPSPQTTPSHIQHCGTTRRWHNTAIRRYPVHVDEHQQPAVTCGLACSPGTSRLTTFDRLSDPQREPDCSPACKPVMLAYRDRSGLTHPETTSFRVAMGGQVLHACAHWHPRRWGTLDGVARPDPSESLTALLGGRRAALDATVPAVAFVAAWLVSGRSLSWGVGAALVTGAAVAAVRRRRGDRPLAALLGLLGVSVAALIVLYTGRAADFFLAQLLSNVASAL